jgi:hypothetical protein
MDTVSCSGRAPVSERSYTQLLRLILEDGGGFEGPQLLQLLSHILGALPVARRAEILRLRAAAYPAYEPLLNAWIEMIQAQTSSAVVSEGNVLTAAFFSSRLRLAAKRSGFVRAFVKEVVEPALRLSSFYSAKLASALQQHIDHGETNAAVFTEVFASGTSSARTRVRKADNKTQATPGSNDSAGQQGSDAPPAALSPLALPSTGLDLFKNDMQKQDTSGHRSRIDDSLASPSLPEDHSLLVTNSGLVILYPYLNMFLKAMSFVKDGKFRSEKKQRKAAQALHYLACGSYKTPEQDMILNKVLVGLPLNEPIPARLRLTKKQKEECDMLLQSVLTHWPGLGSTSVAGLQGSFLWREGILKPDDTHWLLHVEEKAYDVLLDGVPWPFRFIKLPWNEYVINVQWR